MSSPSFGVPGCSLCKHLFTWFCSLELRPSIPRPLPAGSLLFLRPRGGARGSSPTWEPGRRQRLRPHPGPAEERSGAATPSRRPLRPWDSLGWASYDRHKTHLCPFSRRGYSASDGRRLAGQPERSHRDWGHPPQCPWVGFFAGLAGSDSHSTAPPAFGAHVGLPEFPGRGCAQEGIGTSRSLPRRRAGSCRPYQDQPFRELLGRGSTRRRWSHWRHLQRGPGLGPRPRSPPTPALRPAPDPQAILSAPTKNAPVTGAWGK